MIKGASFDLLSGVENAQTPLFLTLVGFRKSVAQQLGLTELPLVPNQNKKIELRKEERPSYPYGYIKLQSMELIRDSQPAKAIQKYASGLSLDEITNAMVSKAYLFPARLAVELHYIDNDFRRVLNIAEKLCIFGGVDAFSFRIEMPGANWIVNVKVNEGPIDIPESDIENPAEPDAWDILVGFQLESKIGIVKSVPKINNAGEVTKTYKRETSSGVTIEM